MCLYGASYSDENGVEGRHGCLHPAFRTDFQIPGRAIRWPGLSAGQLRHGGAEVDVPAPNGVRHGIRKSLNFKKKE